MTPITTVTAVLACHNRRERTQECLQALVAQEGEFKLTTIVVDDGSTDGTSDMVRDGFAETEIVHTDGNQYWARAMRLGVERAMKGNPDYILWLNDDVVLKEGAVQTLLEGSDDAGAGRICVGSVADPSTGTVTYGGQVMARRYPWPKLILAEPKALPYPVATMNGNVVLIPERVENRLGGLDPSFVHNLADWDYGLRAGRAGVEVVLAPGILGTCSHGTRAQTYGDLSLGLAERVHRLHSPKGMPVRPWRLYARRHAGAVWPLYFAAPYVYILRSHAQATFRGLTPTGGKAVKKARRLRLLLVHLRRRAEVSRVALAKSDDSRSGTAYLDHPRTAVVVQHFNKARNINMLAAGLKASKADERIVLEDGSSDESLTLWAKHLTKKNDFVIRCNDIFEIRSYQRAIDLTRSQIIALLQDDDEMPSNGEWLAEAVSAFDADPRLAILGGRDGLEILPLQGALPPGAREEKGLYRYRLITADTSAPPRYVMAINRAPMIVRKSAMVELGGIDQSYAPFQCDDVELCLRAWTRGWRVALYDAGFPRRNLGEGGMRLFNGARTKVQAQKNWPRIYAAYGDELQQGVLLETVNEMNTGNEHRK